MRSCIIHIGIPKTGTTFLQNYFFENRDALLRKNGILYPESLGTPLHRKFSAAIQANRNTAPDKERFGITDDNALEFAQAVMVNFDEELETVKPHRVLISSEFCVNFNDREISILADTLHARFDDVKVIVYLRRQDEHALSGFAEASKWGGAAERELFPAQTIKLHDYKSLLQSYIDKFGLAAIAVRRFGRAYFHGGNLLQDFMHTIGASMDVSEDILLPVNQTLGPKKTEFLRAIDTYVQDALDAKARTALVRAIRDVGLGEARVLPQGATAYYRNFSAINEWVRATFFASEKALFVEPDPKSEGQPDALSREDVLRLVAEIIRDAAAQAASAADQLKLRDVQLARARNKPELALKLISSTNLPSRKTVAPILVEQAELFLGQGLLDDALQTIEKALELDHDNKRARAVSARILRRLGSMN